ncbi:MAG: 50S ribosomal protein L30 [Deltaproteobacteria bacterium]|nr:MAG: 50S ribosomal protein L30 [Deltaproteobacteria bacterium]
MSNLLWIKQIRGLAGKNKNQLLIMKGLGLKHVGDERTIVNSQASIGMLKKVSHLIYVERKKEV